MAAIGNIPRLIGVLNPRSLNKRPDSSSVERSQWEQPFHEYDNSLARATLTIRSFERHIALLKAQLEIARRHIVPRFNEDLQSPRMGNQGVATPPSEESESDEHLAEEEAAPQNKKIALRANVKDLQTQLSLEYEPNAASAEQTENVKRMTETLRKEVEKYCQERRVD